MTTKIYDFDSALAILDLLDDGVELAEALATADPIGEIEIEEVKEGV